MLNTLLSSQTYNGNGATTNWDYDFKIWTSSELEIWLTDADGNETQVTDNYNLTGIGEDDGGTVVYPVTGDPIVSGVRITLRRVLPLLQDFLDIENSQSFNADTLEEAIDKVVAIAQQLKTTLGLCFRGALADAGSVDPELPAAEAGKVLAWNDDEDGLENITVIDGAVSAGSIGSTELGDDSVTAAKVNVDVAGDGLVQAVDGSLEVNVDDSTIEIDTDVVQVKDAGITTAKLANGNAQVFVSANDTTGGRLNGKLVAGDNINLTEGNDAGDETLTIDKEFRGALVGLFNDENVTSGETLNIPWDVVHYDTDDFSDADDVGTNPERFTIPENVSYVRLSAGVAFDSDATPNGSRTLFFSKSDLDLFPGNPLDYIPDVDNIYDAKPVRMSIHSAVLAVSEGDYFTVKIHNTDTGTVTLSGTSGSAACWFAIEVIQ